MLLVYSQKYSYKLINYFKPPQIFPTNYPNIPHIITQLGPSQILPIISHILPNLGSHRYFLYYPTCAHTNTSYTITKNGLQNYAISIKAQTHLPCGQNPKSPTKLSFRAHCYMTPLKPITTWHL